MKSLGLSESIFFPILIIFVACSATSGSEMSVDGPWERDAYIISARKNDQAKRINLYLENKSSADLCIESSGWPKKGRMDDCAPEDVVVVYESRRIGFKEPICTDCFGSEDEIGNNPNYCQYRIGPGSRLYGYINYEEFSEDLSGMQSGKMTLNFPYPAYACEDWKATGQPSPLLPQ